MIATETSPVESESKAHLRVTSLETKLQCKEDYINGKGSLKEVSIKHGVALGNISKWCMKERWAHARVSRLRDRSADIAERLDALDKLIKDEVDPKRLQCLWTAYDKAWGVLAWMRGIARPGVTQTSKPSSRGKSGFESPS